jgi:hypothetical protein
MCHDAILDCSSAYRATNTASKAQFPFLTVPFPVIDATEMNAEPGRPPLHGLEAMMTYLKPKVAKLLEDFLDQC